MSQGFTQGITVPVPVSKGGTGSATGDASGLNGYLISALDDVAWASFSPSPAGFSAISTAQGTWKQIGKTVFVDLLIDGTSNATTFSIGNLPAAVSSGVWQGFHFCTNNSGNSICSVSITGTTATLYNGTTSQISGWTASGGKSFYGMLIYSTT